MRSILVGIATLLIMSGVATAGPNSKQVRYVGIHPVPKAAGGGFCHIEGPHVHVFGATKLEYRDYRGYNHFVGDPVAYGYDGPRHSYRGHHPIQVDLVVGMPDPDVEYCYIDGPHFHYFAPPANAQFEVVGDVNFYVGPPAPAYVEARPAMMQINAVYTPIVYARPVVTVDPPVGWIGARAEFVVATPAVIVEPPHAHVVTPGVVVDAHVHVPAPTLRVEFGVGIGGGAVIGGGHRHDNGKHKFKRKKRRF